MKQTVYTPFRFFIFSDESKLIGVLGDEEHYGIGGKPISISEPSVIKFRPDALFSFRVKNITSNTGYFVRNTTDAITLNLFKEN